MKVRFGESYLAVSKCEPRPKVRSPKVAAGRTRKPAAPRVKSKWMENFRLTSPEKAALSVSSVLSQARGVKPIR